MRIPATLAAVLSAVLLLSTSASAQSALAGLVKDTSGAVLPGVAVEAASPVLIEKSRTTVTDGTGQYRITNLTPGTYTVTFTLLGFTTVKREGVELTGAGVTTTQYRQRSGTCRHPDSLGSQSCAAHWSVLHGHGSPRPCDLVRR